MFLNKFSKFLLNTTVKKCNNLAFCTFVLLLRAFPVQKTPIGLMGDNKV